MSLLGDRIVPADVRQVMDRTDANLGVMTERLAVIADILAEQNSLLQEQNRLLRMQAKHRHAS